MSGFWDPKFRKRPIFIVYIHFKILCENHPGPSCTLAPFRIVFQQAHAKLGRFRV